MALDVKRIAATGQSMIPELIQDVSADTTSSVWMLLENWDTQPNLNRSDKIVFQETYRPSFSLGIALIQAPA